MNPDFHYTYQPNPHTQRGRALIKAHPEVRKLMGPYWPSALYTTGIVAAQWALAGYLSTQSWIWIFAVSYLIGAIANHALFAQIHEATHNLILKGNTANKWMGILCNVGQGVPSAIGFRTFHLIHHSHMNEYDYDADLAFHTEAKLVKNVWWRKILWSFLFMFIEVIRPAKLKAGDTWKDKWTYINLLTILATDALLFWAFGLKGLAYILLSTFFSIGLHPVGARWVQEHYTFKEGQETYSYYGPLNKVNFNIGYHNEHHDLNKIPWVHLPKLKKMAPEFYDHLYAHHSWTKLLLRFFFDKNVDLYSRIVRHPRERSHRSKTAKSNLASKEETTPSTPTP